MTSNTITVIDVGKGLDINIVEIFPEIFNNVIIYNRCFFFVFGNLFVSHFSDIISDTEFNILIANRLSETES